MSCHSNLEQVTRVASADPCKFFNGEQSFSNDEYFDEDFDGSRVIALRTTEREVKT